MIKDFLSLPFQSPVIVSQSDGWGLTSWMLKHRGRGWPSFPRKNRCGGLCGNQVQVPHTCVWLISTRGRWRRTALAHLVGAELVHERVVEPRGNNDLERYCEVDVKRGVADALRVQVTYPRDESKRLWRCGLQQPPLILAAANRTRVLRFYDLAPVEPNVEVCGAAPAAWTTKKSGVTYACRVLGFERDRPGCVDRLLARMRATAPGDRHTPGCGLFKRGARGRPPP